jgi:hypothetical protein
MTVRHSLIAALPVRALILGLGLVARAADGRDQPRVARRGDIPVDTNRVLIPVSVTTASEVANPD